MTFTEIAAEQCCKITMRISESQLVVGFEFQALDGRWCYQRYLHREEINEQTESFVCNEVLTAFNRRGNDVKN